MKTLFTQSKLILIVSLGLILASCSSGKKAYERGEFKTAVLQAIDRLQSSPGNKKSTQILAAAYPSMLDWYTERIERNSFSNDATKWEKVMNDYGTLNQVYEAIRKTPAAASIVANPRSFYAEFESAKAKAIEWRYAMGLDALAEDTRIDAKAAYAHFERVLDLDPSYKDAGRKIEEARQKATIYIKLEKIPLPSRQYELNGEFFENQVIEYAQKTTFSPFVQFLPRQSGRRPDYRGADHVIRLRFDDFAVGQVYEKEYQIDRTKDSVKTGTARVADSTVATYGTVKARVFAHQKEISSTGLLDAQILDGESGAVLSQRKFPGTFVWYDYWGTFEGDRRALLEEDEKYISKKRPLPEPYPQDLFVEFTRPIFGQLTDFIKDYYDRY